MSRSQYIGLHRAESTVLGGALARVVRRRAALEEALLAAYAASDRERVSKLRGEIEREMAA